jgi:hypothetical protein
LRTHIHGSGAVPPFPVLRLINKSAYVTRCVVLSPPSLHARTNSDGRARTHVRTHSRTRARTHARTHARTQLLDYQVGARRCSKNLIYIHIFLFC